MPEHRITRGNFRNRLSEALSRHRPGDTFVVETDSLALQVAAEARRQGHQDARVIVRRGREWVRPR